MLEVKMFDTESVLLEPIRNGQPSRRTQWASSMLSVRQGDQQHYQFPFLKDRLWG